MTPSSPSAATFSEAEAAHPFVTALPPATDYLSYLTIVEANLDVASLPLLARLLQDERLTTNIGWDLVHLLTPLLPEAADCLDAIARLGNPREVVLKVTEMLEMIGYDAAAAEELDEDESEDGDEDGGSRAEEDAAQTQNGRDEERWLRVLQFKHLLRMIGILHPRIKTKKPSRFLLTSAEAVLSAYNQLNPVTLLQAGPPRASDQNSKDATDTSTSSPHVLTRIPIQAQSATDAILVLLADLSTVTRPPLPPRLGSASSILSQMTLAADPEAEPIDADEGTLQRYILISVATRVSETLNARLRESLPAKQISLAQRYTLEKFPAKRVPHRSETVDAGVEARAKSAQGALTKLETVLATKLGVKADKLADLVIGSGREGSGNAFGDFPISENGALLLWAYSMFNGVTEKAVSAVTHKRLVAEFLGGSSSIDFSPESLATIDAVLYLGWLSLEATDGGEKSSNGGPEEDQQATREETQGSYNEYLQQISVISANASDAELRYQSHLLVTEILRHTQDSGLKYGFIEDTLECCPFDNLKVTAVGWLKDEILAAAKERRSSGKKKEKDENMFGRAETLDKVAVSLFDADVDEDAGAMATQLPMWLAVLNLLYVVCLNMEISETLGVASLLHKYEVKNRFVRHLEAVSLSLLQDEQRDGAGHMEMLSDASLLSDAVSRAKEGMAKLER